MARPMTNSARYFPFDVDYFSDRRIRRLKRDHSILGIVMHISLLCSVYSDSSGYFTRFDENLIFDLAERLGIDEEECKDMVSQLVRIGLFDKKVFEKQGVLTSKSIQLRFQEIIKSRGQKRRIFVDKNLWLLNARDTADYIHFEGSFSENNYTKEIKERGNKNEIEIETKGDQHEPDSSEDSASAVIKEYHKYIGKPSPNVESGLLQYLEKGFEKELIIRLIHYTCEQGKCSWQYLDAALRGNEKAGIKTLAEYNKAQKSRESKRNGFCNYTDTNNFDYAEVERQCFEEMLAEYDDIKEKGALENDRKGD